MMGPVDAEIRQPGSFWGKVENNNKPQIFTKRCIYRIYNNDNNSNVNDNNNIYICTYTTFISIPTSLCHVPYKR